MKEIHTGMTRAEFNHSHSVLVFADERYGIPRKLKCPGCQLGDHCNGDDDGCYCECTDQKPSV